MSIHMRKSRILRKIRNGEVVVSAKCNLSDIRGIELAAMCGFDAIWIDMEHVPNSYSDIEKAVLAAKAYDCDIITRTSRGGYSNYIRPLEADSAAIMVPHVMSLKEAKEIVYYSKFHPIGRRPLDGGNADGGYCLVDALEYMETANKERITIIQIEDPEPLEELEEIAALPGIDMLFFGPADFSQGIGAPCDFSNPKLLEARKRVVECAKRHGKLAGTTGSPANFKQLADEGFNLINIAADVVILGAGYKNALSSIENL
ncbi:MAG: aldolase [Clostridia bacterium]|nr:aldolase [Clostridia bacterium]